MRKRRIRFEGNMADELLKLYPNGFVLGCYGIVGKFGVEINYNNGDGTKGQKLYTEGEEIPITKVKGKMLELATLAPLEVSIHSDFFKGFRRTVKK